MPARASTDETAARATIVALHRTWNAIRARHGEVPPVVLAIGTASPRRVTRLVRLGHFARWRWFAAHDSDPDPLRRARATLRDAIDNDDLSAALGAHADILLLTAVQLSREARTSVGEVLVTREGLDRGAAEVLATLLPWRRGRIQTLGMPSNDRASSCSACWNVGNPKGLSKRCGQPGWLSTSRHFNRRRFDVEPERCRDGDRVRHPT